MLVSNLSVLKMGWVGKGWEGGGGLDYLIIFIN